MTQEQLKEQAYQYVTDNLNDLNILELVNQLIENVSNDLIYDNKRESNRLTTAYLIINEVIQSDQ